MSENRKFRWATWWAVGVAPWVTAASSTPPPPAPSDFLLNQNALRLQREAIDKITPLLSYYRGAKIERRLAILAVEMAQQAATLEFRAAHGVADQKGGEADLQRYRRQLQDVIRAAGAALAVAPADIENAHLLFLRAQAYEELEQKEAAKKDYVAIATQFPDSPWAIRGDLALADRAAENNAYREALPFLKKVLEHEDDPHYVFALNKTAWAYFNLQQLDDALPLAEKQVRFYDDKAKGRAQGLLESERALREHALLDFAEFYFSGVERRLPGYTLNKALDTFRDLDRHEGLGKMILRFAKLLRSRKLTAPLREWAELMIQEEPMQSETASVIATAIDAEIDLGHYERVPGLLTGLSRLDERTKHALRRFESYPTTLKQLLGWASKLQKKEICLAAVYSTYLDLAEPNDPLLPQVHFNLAETQFQLKDFAKATLNYRWLVDNNAETKGLSRSEVRLRAATSRYQELKAKKYLAAEVIPKALGGPEDVPWDKTDDAFAEWVHWLDAYETDYGTREAAVAGMRLAADLTIYQQGFTLAATNRLLRQLRHDPAHAHAVADASLVLDTYFAGKQWVKADALASEFLKLIPLGREPFAQRLLDAKADAFYQRLDEHFEKKDFAGLLALVPAYWRDCQKRDRDADTLVLASRAASQLQDPATARQYLNIALTEFPHASARANALVARGTLSEAENHFEKALTDYSAFLTINGVPAKQKEAVQRRVFELSWLTGNTAALTCATPSWDCEKYLGLSLLRQANAGDDKRARQKASEGPKENRAVWAALALRSTAPMTIAERLKLAEQLVTGWNDLDPVAQFALIPDLNATIPAAFAQVRKALRSEAPLRPTTAAITRRIKLLGMIEATAGNAIKLPWARVRVAVLSEVAQAYLAFSHELAAIPKPQGFSADELAAYTKSLREITEPFEEKGKTLAAQANEVGADLAIDANGIDGLGTPAPRAPASATPTLPMELGLLDNLEGKTWSNLVIGIQPRPADNLRALWVEALRKQAWGRVAYFSQAYLQQEKPTESVAQLMKAISLYAVGAHSEALTMLDSLRGNLPDDIRERANDVLVSNYQQTMATKKAEALAKTIGNEWVAQMIKGVQ